MEENGNQHIFMKVRKQDAAVELPPAMIPLRRCSCSSAAVRGSDALQLVLGITDVSGRADDDGG